MAILKNITTDLKNITWIRDGIEIEWEELPTNNKNTVDRRAVLRMQYHGILATSVTWTNADFNNLFYTPTIDDIKVYIGTTMNGQQVSTRYNAGTWDIERVRIDDQGDGTSRVTINVKRESIFTTQPETTTTDADLEKETQTQ